MAETENKKFINSITNKAKDGSTEVYNLYNTGTLSWKDGSYDGKADTTITNIAGHADKDALKTDLNNYVTLDTEQTISAIKTFSGTSEIRLEKNACFNSSQSGISTIIDGSGVSFVIYEDGPDDVLREKIKFPNQIIKSWGWDSYAKDSSGNNIKSFNDNYFVGTGAVVSSLDLKFGGPLDRGYEKQQYYIPSVKAVNDGLAKYQKILSFDSVPTSSSTNPVTSGGIYSALADKVSKAGDTFGSGAVFSFPDSGNWGISNSGVTFPVDRGGFNWSGQSDGISLHGVETENDNLELQLKFTDDNSNGLTILNNTGNQTARISASGNISAASFTEGGTALSSKYYNGTHSDSGSTDGITTTVTVTAPGAISVSMSGSANTANYANTAGTANSVAWSNVSDKPATATRWPSWSEVTNKPALATVATSGSYNDLSNKPDLNAKADNHRHFKSGDNQRTGVYTYYKLASFPIDNSDNSCSLMVDGRIGGWNNGNKGYLSMIISNRDEVAASGTLIGNADLSLCDLVVYTSGATSTNSTAILYAKTYSWFAFDLTLGPMQGVTDIWDDQGTNTTPAGTLAWTLSGNANKFLRIKDNGDINAGADLAVNKNLAVGGAVTVGGRQLAKVATTNSYNDLDNKPAFTAGSGILIETSDDGTVKIACSYSDGDMETY